jgi:hypothetical protein
MTVADVTAADEDAVRPLLEGPEHVMRRHRAGAHHPDDPDIGGILQATHPRQVGPGIGAPVTEKPQNLRFELFFCHISTFYLDSFKP